MGIRLCDCERQPTFLVRFEEDVPGNIMLTERNTAFFTEAEQVETYDFMEAQTIPYTGKYI